MVISIILLGEPPVKNKKINDYIVFWLSQSVSQLGSSMTSFALIIWAYKQTNSAMSVSLLTFFSYMPYILFSIFAGAFVDNHNKRSIMLWTDSIACICSIATLGLLYIGKLEIWHIYIVNAIIGLMNAFQNPASTVTIGILVPKEKYAKISGMNSFSNSLITVITPMFAASISSFWGLKGVFFIDLVTFCFSFVFLLFFIKIPEPNRFSKSNKKQSVFSSCKEGFNFLFQHKGLLYIIISMALLNFYSRLTYENILPAMILSRSGGNNNVLGVVSGVVGFGGILGGIFVSVVDLPKDNLKLIYFSAAFSFLFGDLLMGLGQNIFIWILAAIGASVPIPFITAGQNVILYNTIPTEIQGRVFAVRNALQYFTIPIGTLLGGALADYAFEPFMKTQNQLSYILHMIVGNGDGSGMSVMFLCTGVLGFISSAIFYKNKQIRNLLK